MLLILALKDKTFTEIFENRILRDRRCLTKSLICLDESNCYQVIKLFLLNQIFPILMLKGQINVRQTALQHLKMEYMRHFSGSVIFLIGSSQYTFKIFEIYFRNFVFSSLESPMILSPDQIDDFSTSERNG